MFVRGSLIVHVIRSNLLVSIEDGYFYLGIASRIIMMCRNAYCLARSQGSHFEN
jgi:hypothetical protein